MSNLSETNYQKIQDLDYRVEKLKAQVIANTSYNTEQTINFNNLVENTREISNNLQECSYAITDLEVDNANLKNAVSSHTTDITQLKKNVDDHSVSIAENNSDLSTVFTNFELLKTGELVADYSQDWSKNLKFERSEIIFDMSNPDSTINWGYTSGIKGDTIFTVDLTKYKRLEITVCCDKTTSSFIVDMEHQQFCKYTIQNCVYVGGCCAPITTDLNFYYVALVGISESKTYIDFNTIGFVNSSMIFNLRNQNIAYYFSQIKGVY